jgi:hypothetical protein
MIVAPERGKAMRLLGAVLLMAVAAGRLPAAVTVGQYHVHDFSFGAQAAGNPFDVELTGEFTGPGGVRIVVPGFYDGDNTWKIRFAATISGQWSMRTISPVAALNDRTESAITATANTNKAIRWLTGGSAALHPFRV